MLTVARLGFHSLSRVLKSFSVVDPDQLKKHFQIFPPAQPRTWWTDVTVHEQTDCLRTAQTVAVASAKEDPEESFAINWFDLSLTAVRLLPTSWTTHTPA